MSEDVFPVDELQKRLAAGESPFLVDVRDAEAFAAGHVAGAVNRPIDSLDPEAIAREAGGAPVLTLCGGGTRAGKAAATLRAAGVEARAIAGGTKACQAAGVSVVSKGA